MEILIKSICEDLQANAMPYENFVYEPKATHQIIRKHLESIIVVRKCKYVKREGESCTLNNNCKYPFCHEK